MCKNFSQCACVHIMQNLQRELILNFQELLMMFCWLPEPIYYCHTSMVFFNLDLDTAWWTEVSISAESEMDMMLRKPETRVTP